jgi:hypothetical protein
MRWEAEADVIRAMKQTIPLEEPDCESDELFHYGRYTVKTID